jgi:AbrB family looped-hinge helix DNA binding protein
MANSPKVSRVQKRGQVTIPIEIRQRIGLEEGDLVAFVETPQGVLLTPQAVVPAQTVNREESSSGDAQPAKGVGLSDLFTFAERLANGTLNENQPTMTVNEGRRIVELTAGIFARPDREPIDFKAARQEFIEATVRRITSKMAQEDK